MGQRKIEVIRNILEEPLNENELKRFWDKVDINPDVEKCWLWTAATTDGYGTFWLRGSLHRAHRVSYFIYNGVFAEQEVDHTCCVRKCVNPLHLEDVTQAENVLRSAKFRYGSVCKKGHPKTIDTTIKTAQGHTTCRICIHQSEQKRYLKKYASQKAKATHSSEMRDFAREPKLNEAKVLDILRRSRFDGTSGRQLAIDFQVSQTMIRLILSGKSWNHVYQDFINKHGMP